MALNGNPEIENDKWLMTENDCAAAPRKKIWKKLAKYSKTATAMSYICNRIKEANSLRRKPAIFSVESKALRFDCENMLRWFHRLLSRLGQASILDGARCSISSAKFKCTWLCSRLALYLWRISKHNTPSEQTRHVMVANITRQVSQLGMS